MKFPSHFDILELRGPTGLGKVDSCMLAQVVIASPTTSVSRQESLLKSIEAWGFRHHWCSKFCGKYLDVYGIGIVIRIHIYIYYIVFDDFDVCLLNGSQSFRSIWLARKSKREWQETCNFGWTWCGSILSQES